MTGLFGFKYRRRWHPYYPGLHMTLDRIRVIQFLGSAALCQGQMYQQTARLQRKDGRAPSIRLQRYFATDAEHWLADYDILPLDLRCFASNNLSKFQIRSNVIHFFLKILYLTHIMKIIPLDSYCYLLFIDPKISK